jgi:flagellar biosynthesis anti-sigma factor FlgM
LSSFDSSANIFYDFVLSLSYIVECMKPLSSTPSPSPSPSSRPETFKTSATSKGKGEPTHQSEPVSLSQKRQEILHYTEVMAKLPEVRQERITEIQLALKKGTYSVSAHDLADKLIQEIPKHTPDESTSST